MAIFTLMNSAGLAIADTSAGSQTLNVFGLGGLITDVSISVEGLAHTASFDIDMLLVGPDETSNLEFWSNIGASNSPDISGNYIISDMAAGLLPGSGPVNSGSYRPTDRSGLATDATFGSSTGGINHAGTAGAATFSNSFGGLNANGGWTLYVADIEAGNSGGLDRWGLNITTDSDVSLIDGTPDDDVITVLSTGLGSGAYGLNENTAVSYSGVNAFYLYGYEGDDIITGSAGADYIYSGADRDIVHAGGGDDEINVFQIEDVAGELYDGGTGMDTLNLSYDDFGGAYVVDLRDDTLKSIERLRQVDPGDGGAATVRLNAAQFGAGFSLTGTVFGTSFPDVADTLDVTMGMLTSINLSGLSFADFEGGLDKVTINGDGDAETITGTSVADRIIGNGGADIMTGLGGNDTYYIDNAGDKVIEGVGQGTADWAATSVSYTLAAGVQVEKFSTTSSGATTAIDLTGNAFAQAISGNAGANRLNGAGGADTMTGLGGNDTYYVDNAGDRVVEGAGQGTADWVATSISYTLAAGVQVERFTTTNNGATSALALSGNEFGQSISGNAGANTINGKAGNDTLTGLGGADVFVFDTGLNSTTNVDTITDYNVAADTIRLENAIFTQIAGTGTLTAAQFASNASGIAADASDRIVYETDTGKLFYDANGNASGGSVLFATLAAGLGLTNADFVVV